MTAAFHGQAEVRDAALARLAGHAADGTLKPAHPAAQADGADGAGVAACLAGSAALLDWETVLGLPKWLALVIDAISATQTPAMAADTGAALLRAIRPGAELGASGGAVIARLLDDAEQALVSTAANACKADADDAAPQPPLLLPQLCPLLDRIRALHRHGGTDLTADAWKTVRRQATALTDTITDPVIKALAAMLESAAWDAQRSRSAVLDTLRLWQQLRGQLAARSYGWGKADDDRVQQHLDQIYARHFPGVPKHEAMVFPIHEREYPDESARLRGKYQHARIQAASDDAHLTALVADVLRQASP